MFNVFLGFIDPEPHESAPLPGHRLARKGANLPKRCGPQLAVRWVRCYDGQPMDNRLCAEQPSQLKAGTRPSSTATGGRSGMISSVASTLSHASAPTKSIKLTGIKARS